MLITYFKDSRTLARYRSGLTNLYLENFIVWLESQGYQRFTIRRHVCEVVHFADWAEAEGLALRDLNRGALNRLCSQLAERNSLRYPCGKQRHICHSAFLLVNFLETVGAVESRPPHISTQEPALLLQFREWMRTQRWTLDITLNGYRQPILDLLDDLGTEPSTFDAIGLREFLLRRVSCFSQWKSKNLATAVRMFLRFLIARGYCAPGLEHAIPTVAKWRLSSLPKYLSVQDVECLINSCDQSSPLGARDRAILVLIARLGLRAGDVSALKFGDLLWEEGTLIVSGKGRRQTRLPLSQEVGEAILYYLSHGRPRKVSDHIFITTAAPLVPISRQAVGQTVARAIRCTGISAPTKGSHLLRHSAATRLLREGVSLPTIGALLRHASIETTTVYAKVDVDLLQEVAMPWPEEVQPC
jgi:site-specific recombinase XerD